MALANDSKKFSSEAFDCFSALFHCARAAITSRKRMAFMANTKLAPEWLKITAAATGPIIPQRLNCNPPSVTADASSFLVTTSGTTELQAGALNEKPTPIKKTHVKIKYGFSKSIAPSTASTPAQIANHRFIVHNSFFRSTISAREPAGSVNKKNGREATVDITEIKNIDELIVFIIQDPASS